MVRAALIGRRSKNIFLGMGSPGMAGAGMEHIRGGDYPGVSFGGTMEMEAACTGCGLVDRGGSAGHHMLYSLDEPSVGGKTGGGSMLGVDRPGPVVDWNSLCRGRPLVDNKEEQMMDPRPVSTIEGLDAHLYHIMQQLKEIRDIQASLATRAELDSKIAALEQKISQQSPKSVWRGITEISVGIAAIAAAGGVVVAVVRYLHL
jgi:hypothetical protein